MKNDLFLKTDGEWLDAGEKYGANLEDGTVLELMIPNPKKDYVESNVRNSHGRIMRGVEWDDTSEKSLTFHIVGSDMADSFKKFKSFCDDILASGRFMLKSKYIKKNATDLEEFTFVYRNCTPISSNNGILKFNVKVVKEFFEQKKESNEDNKQEATE